MRLEEISWPLFFIAALIGGVIVFPILYINTAKPPQPVACASIPDTELRHIVVKDGAVTCVYNVTKVRERK